MNVKILCMKFTYWLKSYMQFICDHYACTLEATKGIIHDSITNCHFVSLKLYVHRGNSLHVNFTKQDKHSFITQMLISADS